jgi:two-component system response regulator
MDTKIVLLAEDNPSDEELTIRALKRGGLPIEVSVVRDGEQALAYLLDADADSRPLPDLLLLDLNLPKINGLDVLARIRSDERIRHLLVIIVSSSSKPEDVEAAYRLGCNGYLTKGVDYLRFVESARILAQYWLVYNVPPVPARMSV